MGKRLHALLLALVAVVGALLLAAHALRGAAATAFSGMAVQSGAVYAMGISVCQKRQSALDMLAAKQLGDDHANKLFDALADCDNAVLAFRVGQVIHEITTAAGDAYRVVEIHAPGNDNGTLYWLTSMQVVARVAKPGEKPSMEILQPQPVRLS